MVELRDVHMQFEEKNVLEGVSLDVQPQERLVIMGQSGSGKSTILRLILGILRPDSGSVFFKQFEINRLEAQKTSTGATAHRDGLSIFGAIKLAHGSRECGAAAGGAYRQIAQRD